MVADRIGLTFDLDDPTFVTAVGDADDRELSGLVLNAEVCREAQCWIRVLTAPMRVITIRTVGNLYVTKDSSPSSSRILLAGERTETLLRLAFNATGEDVRVQSIAIQGATGTIDTLELYDTGASSPFAVARTSQCPVLVAGLLCATTDFIVKNLPTGSRNRGKPGFFQLTDDPD